MKPADALPRFLAVLLGAAALFIACAALSVANSTRSTPAGQGVVFRENLWTGRAEFCGLAPDGLPECRPVR